MTIQELCAAARSAGSVTEFERDWRKWRGDKPIGRFAHWCWDWDGLPVDETCVEASSCNDVDYDDAARIEIQRASDEFEKAAGYPPNVET